MEKPFPLGRIKHHDPRSLSFAAPTLNVVRTKSWRRYGSVLDQGDLGSCTGNAAAHAANSLPLHLTGQAILKESDAVELYSRATVLDGFDGTYPPDDTGSSGIGVAKAGIEKGLWTRYEWAFGFDHALSSLMEGPLLIGTNWHTDMFYPNSYGFVKPTGEVAGGHEYLLTGVSVVGQYVTFQNSWSYGWGLYGKFRMHFADFKQLLAEDGDAMLLRR